MDIKDGKTKDRVESWRKNIHQLTGDLKKQVKILEDIDNGDSNETGNGDMRKDYFIMIATKLSKDIEELVRICQKLMVLNMKKQVQSQEDNEKSWSFMRQTIRNEAMKVMQLIQQDQSIDKFMLLAKLMNMRENLLKQIFHSSLYRKLIIWNDLNIQCDEFVPQKIVQCIN